MNEQRLLETATFLYFVSLDKEARKHFNMSYYRLDAPSVPICKTSACAFGWTAEMYPEEISWDRCFYNYPTPRYKNFRDMSAVAAFYDLERADAEMLFGGCKRTPKREADLICRFVERRTRKEGREQGFKV